MAEQVCPVCGCSVVGEAHEKDGVKYCCEPCADAGGHCDCGCCHPAENEEK